MPCRKERRRHFYALLLLSILLCSVMTLRYWQSIQWTVEETQRSEGSSIDFFSKEQNVQVTNSSVTSRYGVKATAERIAEKTRYYADEDSAGLLVALLTGKKDYLSLALRDLTRRSGASHLLALSGFHLNLLLFFLMKIRRKSPQLLHCCISLLLVWGYCVWIGFIPSLYRAAVMLSVVLLARQFWGGISFISVWSYTTMLMLLCVPDILRELGFVLSQLALLGVVYGRFLFPPFLRKYLSPVVMNALCIGLGALFSTGWYSFLVFGQVYPVAVVSAMLLSPLVMLFIFLGLCFLFLPAIWAGAAGYVLSSVAGVIRLSMSYASQIGSVDNWRELLLLYFCFFSTAAITLYLKHKK